MKSYWYANGLHFECLQCGRCCAGPAEGYIWVSRPEIELIANYLKETIGQVRRKFLRRVGLRTTIIEDHFTKDCIFLQESGSQKTCVIYPVRPSQCRSWPFWANNLESPDAWNKTAQKCPGINRGRLYSYEEIDKIKKTKIATKTQKINTKSEARNSKQYQMNKIQMTKTVSFENLNI